MLEEQRRLNSEMERYMRELEKAKETEIHSLSQELNYSKKSENDLIAKRVAEQKRYAETVSTLILQKSELQMSQAEYECQMKAEREKVQQEAIRAAQAEAAAKCAQEALNESPSGTVKCIAEMMENFAKRTRMDPDFSD